MPLPAALGALSSLGGLIGGGSQTTANNSLTFGATVSPSVQVVVQGQGGQDAGSNADASGSASVVPSIDNTPQSGLAGQVTVPASAVATNAAAFVPSSTSIFSPMTLLIGAAVIGGGFLLLGPKK